MQVLIADPLAKEGLEILNKEKEIKTEVKLKLSEEDLIKEIPKYDALIVRSGTKVTRKVIEAAKKMKVIGRAGEGLDNVDIEAATEKGIIVMNTPGANTISAAEHTMSLILALARNVAAACHSLKEGKWERNKYLGVELYNKTLGIIGLGKIGMEVCKRAQSFGMKILAYDPFISEDVANRLQVVLTTLPELLRNSDFITVHIPLNKETRGLISTKEFDLMKPSARIINCARGGIIDEVALQKALEEKKIAGAALDVFEKEPPDPTLSLLKCENILLTPHLGASTEEAQEKVSKDVAKQVADALLNRGVRNAVNIPSIEPEVLLQLKPYLGLCEKLGSFLAQIAKGRTEGIEIEYRGDILNYELSPLTLSLLKGVLESILQEPVNFVNAPVVAKTRGIKVSESKSKDIEDYTHLIALRIKTDKEVRYASATLLGKNDPRIVHLDDFHIDAKPEGHILICLSFDVPGVIGQIGTVLGKQGINIAALQYDRKIKGGEAITVLNVDASVSDAVLKELTKVKEIKQAKLVSL